MKKSLFHWVGLRMVKQKDMDISCFKSKFWKPLTKDLLKDKCGVLLDKY